VDSICSFNWSAAVNILCDFILNPSGLSKQEFEERSGEPPVEEGVD
jgi:hypothetical protein